MKLIGGWRWKLGFSLRIRRPDLEDRAVELYITVSVDCIRPYSAECALGWVSFVSMLVTQE